MKRIFSLIFLIVLAVNAIAQSGTGIITDPYYGDISTSPVWSLGTYPGNTVYVGTVANPDLKIINGGHLTINPGITVIFTQLTSDLLITGSGQLTALGTSSLKIKFTKAPANGHWGHISFETPGSGDPISGTGSFDYCIIEYGYAATSGTTPDNAGGGLQINASGVVVDHCLFENNYSNFGGAVTVNAGRNTIIRNSNFKTNSVNEAGGALLLWTSSTARVENCIFELNHSTGTSSNLYSGGAIWSLQNSSIIVNCTFVKNTSNHAGDAIYSYASAGMQIINCILWGSSTQFAGDYTTTTIVNCAFETAKPANAINSIIISNIGSDHFVNAGASDWTLKFISPCRDAGTAAGAPSTDILGKFRIGLPDIGAYEVQYSRWNGSSGTAWTIGTNWDAGIIPIDGSSDVIIPFGLTNYPIGSSSLDFIIGTGKFMILNPGAKATFNTLTNNGTINLNSDASGIYSLLMNSYTGTGIANIGMYLTGGGGTDHWAWHYVAVPANYTGNKTMFTSIDLFDLMQYDDSQIPNTLAASDNDGWVWHDGYLPGPPPSLAGPGFSSLFIGKGYAFYHPGTSAIVNFTNLSSLLTTLGPLSLQYNGTSKTVPSNYGFNLVGNSLTCGLNWNLINLTGNVNNVIYYTINYKIGSYVRDAPSGINGATKDIPPLQGFLVKTNALGTSLDFSNAREHTSQPRYKKSLEVNGSDSKGSGPTDPFIKLELNNSGNQDETVIWLNQNATNSFDGAYDGLKIVSAGYDQIYSWSGSQKYGISAIPLPKETDTIPIAVKVLKSGSNFKIIASQFQGLDNYKVKLTDKGNANFVIDLKPTASYTFSSEAGTFPDRFVLTIGAIPTGVSDVIIPDKAFNVFAFEKTLNIDLLNADWEGKSGTLNIFDLTGRKVLQLTKVEWYKGTLTKIPLNIPQGIYIVEIKAENQKFVDKINIIK